MLSITVGSFKIGPGLPLVLIAGPCQIENRDHALYNAEALVKASQKAGVNFIYKSSFDKANRTSAKSARGVGIDKGLRILECVKQEFNCPTLTDIHLPEQCNIVSDVVDILQIPAFLARQTDLIVAAAKTGKIVNIKKGQFMSPDSMLFAIQKVKDSGNNNVIITERGSAFGYQDLVIDFRGIPKMKSFAPVVLDITHSLQKPNQHSGITGGQPELIETIAKAGIASGVDGIFIETHPDPSIAKSDGKNMLKLDKLKFLLEKLLLLKSAM